MDKAVQFQSTVQRNIAVHPPAGGLGEQQHRHCDSAEQREIDGMPGQSNRFDPVEMDERLVGVLQDFTTAVVFQTHDIVGAIMHGLPGPEIAHRQALDVAKHRFDQRAVADDGDALSVVCPQDAANRVHRPFLQFVKGFSAFHLEQMRHMPEMVLGFGVLGGDFRVQAAFPGAEVDFPQGIQEPDVLMAVGESEPGRLSCA